MNTPTTEVETYAQQNNITDAELEAIIEKVGTDLGGGYYAIRRRNVLDAKAAIDELVAARTRTFTVDGATNRQVAYLQDLGATDDQLEGLTKAGASALIDALKDARMDEARREARRRMGRS